MKASSDAAKEHVTKLGVLEAAEAKLNELKNAQGYQTQLQNVLAYIRSSVTPKANQSTNGDWAVMALARAGLSSDADKRWYAGYADELAKLLAANGGSFETTNENARLVLALTALGQNAKAYTVGGETYDLVTPLTAKTGSAYKATVPGTTRRCLRHHRHRLRTLYRRGYRCGPGDDPVSAQHAEPLRRMEDQ